MSHEDGAIRGVLAELAQGSGAVARLTALPAGARLDEHVHDLPYLSLHLLGSYAERGEGGEVVIDGPAAAFHPAGSAHGNRIGARGLTTVVVEFDPAWLARELGPGRTPRRSVYWRGGVIANRASALARSCLDPADGEASLHRAAQFLVGALGHAAAPMAEPRWIDRLAALSHGDDGETGTREFARTLGVTPAWLSRAYRACRGEGLAQTLRRRRVEAAVGLLEQGEIGLAEVALIAGFCDQSHMNRVFRAVLRRTPTQVQAERRRLQ